MSRWYDTTFRKPDGNEITFRSSGGTRRTAERTSRRKLRDTKIDPNTCVLLTTVFVPESER